MALMHLDEKWSIEYEPESNDRPARWYRYGVLSKDVNFDNPTLAMFYSFLKLIEAAIKVNLTSGIQLAGSEEDDAVEAADKGIAEYNRKEELDEDIKIEQAFARAEAGETLTCTQQGVLTECYIGSDLISLSVYRAVFERVFK